MDGFLKFTMDILSEPAILVGVMALIGLLLQKKGIADLVKGTMKTILGVVVISAAAGVIVGSLEPFGIMFEHGFNVDGVVPNNEAIVAMAITEFGSTTALIMFFGMIANILIARFTNLKYIFLTGHHTMFMACMIAVILGVAGLTGVNLVFTGSLALGLVMSIFPAIGQFAMRRITGNDNIAIGHFSTVGYAASALTGQVVGKGSRSTEDLKIPKGLSFLRDSAVSVSLTMLVLYLIVAVVAGPTFVEEQLSGGKNFIVFSMLQAFTFAAGFILIQTGVRLVLAEIVPAFKGIATKLVPNAKPALDVPIVFPFAPNAVLIGFFCSFLGGVVGMLALTLVGGVIIIPGVVPHFFTGATAAVFGNATGGVRGATIGSFLNGLIITFLPVFLLPVLGDLGFANSTFSDADFGVVGILLGNISNFFGSGMITVFVVGVTAILVILGFRKKKEDVQTTAKA